MVSADFSAELTVSEYSYFTSIQIFEYVHQYAVLGGFHVAGVWSLFDEFTLSVTAISCGFVRSFANWVRRACVQPDAPVRHAFASGITWSMSTSDASVHVAPSYGLYQLPDVAAHDELVTTFVPSRFSTVSRVLQAPETVFQWGNRSRE